MKDRKQLEPAPERTGPYKTSKVFASVLILASALCHVKDPRKKRKRGHEGILRPITRDGVIHQGSEASNRVKRRRGGMIARKHVDSATVVMSCCVRRLRSLARRTLLLRMPWAFSHSSTTPEVACFVSRSGTKSLPRQPA